MKAPAPSGPSGARFRFRSPAGAAILAGAILLLVSAGGFLRNLATRAPETLPDLGPAGAFSAVGADGRRWKNADLAGTIWIADAITKDCSGCVVRNLRMTDLQTALARAKPVVLVTFVEDPVLAASGKLAELERAFGAIPGRWTFLRGTMPAPAERFLLVDAEGRVRAAVAESDPAVSSKLLDAVGDLLREKTGRRP